MESLLETFLSRNFILEVNCYDGVYRIYATNTFTKESYAGQSTTSLLDATQKILTEMEQERDYKSVL